MNFPGIFFSLFHDSSGLTLKCVTRAPKNRIFILDLRETTNQCEMALHCQYKGYLNFMLHGNWNEIP